MVNNGTALDGTFRALAHPVRRTILAQLARGEAPVTMLAAPFKVSLPMMLKHIHVLENVGLVTSQKSGRVHTCRLNAAPMQEAAEWLAFYEKYWNRKLDDLGDFLETTRD